MFKFMTLVSVVSLQLSLPMSDHGSFGKCPLLCTRLPATPFTLLKASSLVQFSQLSQFDGRALALVEFVGVRLRWGRVDGRAVALVGFMGVRWSWVRAGLAQ